MKALSLWQPWATLIAIGAKRIETRSWPTSYRGPLAIHAAQRWTGEQAAICNTHPFFRVLHDLSSYDPNRRGSSVKRWQAVFPFGCIVAVCRLTACVPARSALTISPENDQERIFGDFSGNRWAWILTDVQLLVKPVACCGARGLFDCPVQL